MSGGGGGTVHEGEAGGMGHRVHMISRTKCGKQKNCLRLAADSPNRSLPPPLSTLYLLLDLEEALNYFLGRYSIVIVDLNADIGHMQNPWNQNLAYFLAFFGLVDLLAHFGKWLRFRHKFTL